MANKSAYSLPSKLEINLHNKSMLTGRKLVLLPIYPECLGGIAEGLVYSQLVFLTGALKDCADNPVVRISYTKLQRHLPFYSRRWLIEIIKRLESKGVIGIVNNGRVNNIEVIRGDLIKFVIAENEAAESGNKTLYTSKLVIFPELACKIGLLEAIALQQIHIRHHVCDGSLWVVRSLKQWRDDTFMFLGEATVKRLFARLKEKNLVFVKDSKSEMGVTKAYRVNYIEVAKVLGIPAPEVLVPELNEWDSDWQNPLTPFAPKIKFIKKGFVPSVHQ